MCLAVPMRIAELNGSEAVCDLDGVKRRIRVDFIKNPAIGDYIISHAGFAIEKLAKEQAELNLAAIREVSDASR